MKNRIELPLIVICLFIGALVAHGQTYDTILPSNPNIQYMGRIDFSDSDSPLFAYPNVSIEAKFVGTSLSVMLEQFTGANYNENYFVSIIDDTVYNKFKASVAFLV